MNKLLFVPLFAFLSICFSSTAYAIHAEIPSETQAVVAAGTTQVQLSGSVRVRGWYLDNINSSKLPANYHSSSYYDERVRLAVNAKVSPNVEGMVELESGIGQRDTYIWGNFGAKPSEIAILQAWILYSGSALFGFPAGIKVGHLPLALAEKEFFDHLKFGDDAIVAFLTPAKGLEINVLTIKLAGDGVSSKIPTFGITDYPGSRTDNTDDLDAYVGIINYQINEKTSVGLNYTYLNLPDLEFSHQNLGVTARGRFSGIGINAAADFQFGKNNGTLSSGAEKKFRGFAYLAGLNYTIEPVTVRGKFAYGSGDGDPTDGKDSQFETYLQTDQHYTLVYEYQVNSTAGRINSGLSNTTYFNIGMDFTPVKGMKASIDGYILKASKTVNGISKNAGWEVDSKITYKVAKNLLYRVDAGYFKPGNFYPETYSSLNNQKKGVVVLRHLVELSF